MKAPSLTTVLNGHNKTLYMPVSDLFFKVRANEITIIYLSYYQTLEALRLATEANLEKSLAGLLNIKCWDLHKNNNN